LIPCLKPACQRKARIAPALPYNVPARTPAFAVKINIRESEYIQGPQDGSRDIAAPPAELLPLVQSLCSQSNHISLHMDVKERTLPFSCVEKPSHRGNWWA